MEQPCIFSIHAIFGIVMRFVVFFILAISKCSNSFFALPLLCLLSICYFQIFLQLRIFFKIVVGFFGLSRETDLPNASHVSYRNLPDCIRLCVSALVDFSVGN